MVNSSGFTKRMHQFLKHHDLSAAMFADTIGVGRSSISHILSGRNKPSLDLLLKIMNKYPDVNLRWFLQGKGSIVNAKKIQEITANSIDNLDEINAKKSTPTPSTNPPNFPSQPPLVTTKDSASLAHKQIDHITYVFTDGSFKQFFPSQS